MFLARSTRSSTRTSSRPTNDRNRLHRSDSDFESIPGQRGLGTRQHGERVREVTEWSLPRVGPFFAGRDDTTVLHLYVAWKIVQLGIPSSSPIWPASSRSAQ